MFLGYNFLSFILSIVSIALIRLVILITAFQVCISKDSQSGATSVVYFNSHHYLKGIQNQHPPASLWM